MLTAGLRRRLGFGVCWLGSVLVIGAGLAGVGLSGDVVVVAVMAALVTFGTTVGGICSMSLRQQITSDHLLGRVTSAFWALHNQSAALTRRFSGRLGPNFGSEWPLNRRSSEVAGSRRESSSRRRVPASKLSRMSESPTSTLITATFEVTSWDDATYVESDGAGPTLARVTVRKTFTGAVEGTSVTELLTAAGIDGGRGYVASELFEGTIDGQAGRVVFQHGGIGDQGSGRAFGNIVPGTGTNALAGLAGLVSYRHDETGAVVTLNLQP
jgi:hypothetical protein